VCVLLTVSYGTQHKWHARGSHHTSLESTHTLTADEHAPVESTCNLAIPMLQGSLASSMLRRVSQLLTPIHHAIALYPLTLALNMSSFAGCPTVNPNLKQLKDVADALMKEGRHEHASLLYQQLLERLPVTPGGDDLDTLETTFKLGLSFDQQHRYAEARSAFEEVLPKFSSIVGDEHPLTLLIISTLGSAYMRLGKFDEALAMLETLLARKVRIHGEDHDDTLDTMDCMAHVLCHLDRFDEAHRTASRGLLLARRVGKDQEVAQFVFLLSQIEQFFGGVERANKRRKAASLMQGRTRGEQLKMGMVTSRLVRSACQQSRPKLAVVASKYTM
jgi:tetratricopeptide (TPR) repeat protein